MRNLLLTTAVLLTLAAPAAAQTPSPEPGRLFQAAPPAPTWNNVARVNLGVGFYNSGWYNCYTVWGYACTSGTYSSYIPFLVGPQVDFHLGGMHNVSVGLTVGIGTATLTYYDQFNALLTQTANATLWEPTVDYVAKFGSPTNDVVSRFRVGGAMYIGPNSRLGGAGRIGAGASLLNTRRLGVGLDLVFEGGGYDGRWIGGLQLLVSPEIHF